MSNGAVILVFLSCYLGQYGPVNNKTGEEVDEDKMRIFELETKVEGVEVSIK